MSLTDPYFAQSRELRTSLTELFQTMASTISFCLLSVLFAVFSLCHCRPEFDDRELFSLDSDTGKELSLPSEDAYRCTDDFTESLCKCYRRIGLCEKDVEVAGACAKTCPGVCEKKKRGELAAEIAAARELKRVFRVKRQAGRCENSFETCECFAEDGFCAEGASNLKKKYMQRFCPKSCNLCP